MIVEVKTHHFKNAVNYVSNEECPLALAIKDVVPENTFVSVGGYDLEIDSDTYNIGKVWENVIQIEQFIKDAKQGKAIDTVTVELTKVN